MKATEDVEDLDHQFAAQCADFAHAQVLATTESTNQFLLDEQPGADLRPRVVWALEQTRGRGRRGRAWYGDPSDSLILSILFTRPAQTPAGMQPRAFTGLPLAIGVGLIHALAQWVPDLQIKWPNDLQRAGRKCVGILVESRQRALPFEVDINVRPGTFAEQRQPIHAANRVDQVVVGVGLNLYLNEATRLLIGQPACGLFDSKPLPSRATMAARIARHLNDAWLQFQGCGLGSVLADWPKFDALANQPVQVLDGDRLLHEGIASGISSSGAMRLRTRDGQIIEIHSGEVSVRRLAGS